MLTEHRKLALAILDDAYLGSYFWRAPSTQRALQTQRDKRQAMTWYIEKRWSLILDHDDTDLPASVPACLSAVLTVWTDRGANVDWGPVCYPPLA